MLKVSLRNVLLCVFVVSVATLSKADSFKARACGKKGFMGKSCHPFNLNQCNQTQEIKIIQGYFVNKSGNLVNCANRFACSKQITTDCCSENADRLKNRRNFTAEDLSDAASQCVSQSSCTIDPPDRQGFVLSYLIYNCTEKIKTSTKTPVPTRKDPDLISAVTSSATETQDFTTETQGSTTETQGSATALPSSSTDSATAHTSPATTEEVNRTDPTGDAAHPPAPISNTSVVIIVGCLSGVVMLTVVCVLCCCIIRRRRRTPLNRTEEFRPGDDNVAKLNRHDVLPQSTGPDQNVSETYDNLGFNRLQEKNAAGTDAVYYDTTASAAQALRRLAENQEEENYSYDHVGGRKAPSAEHYDTAASVAQTLKGRVENQKDDYIYSYDHLAMEKKEQSAAENYDTTASVAQTLKEQVKNPEEER